MFKAGCKMKMTMKLRHKDFTVSSYLKRKYSNSQKKMLFRNLGKLSTLNHNKMPNNKKYIISCEKEYFFI